MRILFITPYYLPDGGPSAPMLTMLAEHLVSAGHEVTVLAAVPHFPTGRVPEEYRKGIWKWEIQNGVRVGRAWIPSGDRANLVHRFTVFAIYQLLATLVGLGQKYDVALVTNPAIETGLPFLVPAIIHRKPVILGVWDVYPEVGIHTGLFHNKTVERVVRFLEDFCLNHSSRIQILGESFYTDLKNHRISFEKMVVIPPWLDTGLIHPMPRLNFFSHQNGLDESFTVLYSGNLGLSQGFETVLDAARTLAAHTDITFLFVGDGSGKASLLRQAEGMKNVRFFPYQPRERLPEVLASSDVSLVLLKLNIGSSSLPSKTFSIMAAGRPVLASVDEGSDVWKLLQESQGGVCVPPEDSAKLAEAILSLKESPSRRHQMGKNGRAWAERYHSPEAASASFVKLFQTSLENI